MPKRFESPIHLPTAVFDGLETVQETGETHLQDIATVQAIATRLGYPEVAAWIEKNPGEYQEGLFRGFVASHRPSKTYNHP